MGLTLFVKLKAHAGAEELFCGLAGAGGFVDLAVRESGETLGVSVGPLATCEVYSSA